MDRIRRDRIESGSSHDHCLPRALAWLLFSCFLLLAGCGAPVVSIEGTITLDHEPLEGVQVLFDQPGAKDGNSFAGRTDASGHFVLKALNEELTKPVAGTYRVSLTTAVAGPDALEHTPLPKERIPKGSRGGTLSFDLPEGGTDEANFDLQSK